MTTDPPNHPPETGYPFAHRDSSLPLSNTYNVKPFISMLNCEES